MADDPNKLFVLKTLNKYEIVESDT
jgi:hypothetical protein